MSTWAYCERCKHSIPFPTVADAIIGEQECPECSHPRLLETYTRRPLIQAFVDEAVPAAPSTV